MTDNLNDYIESGATEEINEVEKLLLKDSRQIFTKKS
tara:strand:- start:106 stop:216 length:111 start_codon:yes stop_codon:yes gene_type:complete